MGSKIALDPMSWVKIGLVAEETSITDVLNASDHVSSRIVLGAGISKSGV